MRLVNVSMSATSETPFSSEFQGLEAMLNNSEPVDWVRLIFSEIAIVLTDVFSRICGSRLFICLMTFRTMKCRRNLKLKIRKYLCWPLYKIRSYLHITLSPLCIDQGPPNLVRQPYVHS